MWIPAEDQSSKFAGRTIVLDADLRRAKTSNLTLGNTLISIKPVAKITEM
jgi:hypothetical protein